MQKLVLRKLNPSDETMFLQAVNSWKDGSGFIFAPDYQPGMPFAEFVQLLSQKERGLNLPEGRVPDTCLFGFVDSKLVGRLSIRHRLNDWLLKVGGNIGYGVIADYRRQGLAKEMLRQSLPIARSLGIEKALVTCDDNNIGSIKTIEANGGILENKVLVGDGKPMKRRYWIEISG